MDVVSWALIALVSIAWLVVVETASEAAPAEREPAFSPPAPARPVAPSPRHLWLDYQLATERKSDADLRALAAGKPAVIADAVEGLIAQRRRRRA